MESATAEDASIAEGDPVTGARDFEIAHPHVQRAVRVGAEWCPVIERRIGEQDILR
jgi:hypothetical protein